LAPSLATSGERDAGHACGGQVLERVDGQVDVPGEQALAQRAHEDAGAPDLRQLGLADVAERGQPDQLDRGPGPLGDQAGHGRGLGHGHRALARAEPQRLPAHFTASLAGAPHGRAGGAQNDTSGGWSSAPGHRRRWVVPEARKQTP
jgi:hypothetical protein